MRLADIVRSIFTFTVIITFVIICRCSTNQLAGSISETTNGRIAGILMEQGGKISEKTLVLLLPADYDPLKDTVIAADTTDSTGFYTFTKLTEGNYTLFASNPVKRTNTVITIAHSGKQIQFIPSDTLRIPGSVKVMLGDDLDYRDGYVYIPGTTVYKQLNAQSQFVILDSVPADKVTDIVYSVRSRSVERVLRYGVKVDSHDSAIVWNSMWKYSRNIVLNTTVKGADISRTILKFPVLIRLTQKNIDFDQVNPAGNDVRFAKNNIFLPYEIERWDAENHHAEIWVKVDTIIGNDSTQSITMYWGNSDADESSDGAAVFDTSDNVKAVWHLGENCSDATVNSYNAASVSALDTTGIIGPCKKFNGSDSVIIPGLLGAPSSLTLSGWAKLDSTDSIGGGEILSIGDAVLIRMDNTRDSTGTSGFIHLSGGSEFFEINSGIFVKKTGWHFVAFTVDQNLSDFALYIDGVKAGEKSDPTKSINYNGVGLNTFIGKHGNGKTQYGFYGMIDEVRVYRAAMNPDYIRLCYMNQKENDALVIFR